MVSVIELPSTSREEDAALAALADLARVVPAWGPCRVIGGHMVTVHVALSGSDARHRPTADADLAAALVVFSEPGFAERLTDLGYVKVDGSRLSRATTYGQAVIDLIAPAPARRALHSQPAGRFHVDKFPGIQYALNEPSVVVDVNAVPLEGSPYGPFRIAVPTTTAALVIKTLAARTRHRDKEDVHRLLAAADATGVTLPAPPYSNLDIGRAAEYLHGPFITGASQQHTHSSIEQSRARRSVPSSSTSDR